MQKKIIIAVLAGTLLAGCQEKPQFSCESDVVTGKVVGLQANAFNNFMSQPGIKQMLYNSIVSIFGDTFTMDDDHQNVKFRLDAIRTIDQNKELGNYECKALLHAEKGTEKSDGIEITYTSEAIDGGKNTYVQTQIVNNIQMGELAAVLLKPKEYIEKIGRGTLSSGSLDSSVGDLIFLTNSDVGAAIFKKCGAFSECEVKALVEESEHGDWIKKVISVRQLD